MAKKAVWISYDFGLKGDYTGLYTWLDNHEAVECGSGLAYISYDITKRITNDNLIEEISQDIKEYVKLAKGDRLYVICRDSVTKLVRGEFVNGSRKQAPWEGFGKLKDSPQSDSGE